MWSRFTKCGDTEAHTLVPEDLPKHEELAASSVPVRSCYGQELEGKPH